MAEKFTPTDKHLEAMRLLMGPANHVLLYGGSRSGKTFLIMRAIILRAMYSKRPTTHAVLRHRFNHLKHSIIEDTLPTVMRLCFPQLRYGLNRSDWYVFLPNGSRILFGGLDDKDRTEKVLGQEHSTIYLNECSQISYASRNKAVTRMAQNRGLIRRAFYDCNPPPQGHWLHRMFKQLRDPVTLDPLAGAKNYATLQLNPKDNQPNLPPEYIEELRRLPLRDRIRFLEGEFMQAHAHALWHVDLLDACRAQVTPEQCSRIVIAVDPSGCEGEEDYRSDEIGIMVVGEKNGKGYLFEDQSGHYGPSQWGQLVVNLYDQYRADVVVGEKNYGGAMVKSTIQSVKPNVAVKLVTASRGKHIRAAPVASLYELGKFFHVGAFPDLETQLCDFTTSGYYGEQSPDRADALIWAATELLIEEGGGTAGVW